MHFLAKFLHRCVVIVIPKIHVRGNWPSRLWICSSFRLNLWRSQRENRNSTICWISQNWKLSSKFSLIFENVWPSGFSWQNMKKSVISVLKLILDIYSPGILKILYLQFTIDLLNCYYKILQPVKTQSNRKSPEWRHKLLYRLNWNFR